MKLIAQLFILTGSLLLLSCDKNKEITTIKPVKIVRSMPKINIVEPINNFSLKILKNFAEIPTNNLVVSPQLTFVNLSKFYVASKGATRDELQKACGFDTDNIELLKGINYSNYLLQQTVNSSAVDYKNGDSLWISNKIFLKEPYLTMVKDYLPVEFFYEDFINKNALCLKVNSWAEKQTSNRIKNLVKPSDIDSLTRIFSVNTAFFNGRWLNKFEKELTTTQDFFISKDKKIKVQMMYQKNDFKFSENNYCQIISLPFNGDEFAINLILPHENSGLKDVMEKLTHGELTRLYSSMRNDEIDLFLPKFEFESFIDNKIIMQKLGVKAAFSDKADFSELATESLFIDKMFQKAVIKVDEYGAEAVAADTIGVKCLSMPYTFNANRPFLFFIVHKDTNLILFTGYVVNP
ncbi:serpin family protein [Lentisphaerota bacterium WC36G]|nr:serpin family protein [Lentisphaerae bacterium WC36]